MACRAGATIDEVTGEMNVNEEMVRTAAHFFFVDQFLGFSGSSGPFQVTYRISCGHHMSKTQIYILECDPGEIDLTVLSWTFPVPTWVAGSLPNQHLAH
jgi:hypothetical protein